MSFPLSAPRLVANGNVSPARFLTTVTGAGNAGLCVQASASTAIIVGVSGRNVRYAPGSPGDDGYNAIAGETLDGAATAGMEAELKIGGTVDNWGQLLTTDSSGLGIAGDPTDGTVKWFGALALGTGVSGDFINVWVLPPTPTC